MHRLNRRAGMAALCALLAMPLPSTAQDKPLTIIVGSPPGDTTETLVWVMRRCWKAMRY